jgi:poly(3-hydroxybutyrate) depolymerase
MLSLKRRGVILGVAGLVFLQASPSRSAEATCSADGTPPIQTVQPVTVRPVCKEGRVLSFDQEGVRRYACLNLPRQAQGKPPTAAGWPLLIYLHGSLTTPDSLYLEGRALFDLHDQYPLSNDPAVQGFLILSPEGRRATPYASTGFETGTGFHWDEWYRNSAENLDAKAIDHFLNQVIAMGKVDPHRIYVFGWSNGAYMAELYGIWRSDRIAAIGQYAGADPWSRDPCPVSFEYARKVPLFLMRNLCDALVSCATTSSWIETLGPLDWPFQYRSLGLLGNGVAADRACVPAQDCSTARGILEHVRWPKTGVLTEMLDFLKQHPLP